MKSHTINILKLCRHSGIANPSITHSITLIKKELNPIQDWGGGGGGGGSKSHPNPTSFSPVTSTNVPVRPQNFLTFSFNPFDRLL